MSPPRYLLIVEDEALIAMAFESALSLKGYLCRVVSSGEEALDSLSDQLPDAVIMDIHLAGKLDGIQCAQKMRISHQCPIIFITGYDTQEIRQRGKDLPHVHFLEKPMTVQDLLRTLKNFEQSAELPS